MFGMQNMPLLFGIYTPPRCDILKEDIKVFYVKYNDPIYVKLEKLDIMIRLANPANIANVLAELKEYVERLIYRYLLCLTWCCFSSRYSTEVDVDFVRKSVRAIGRCAIKVESAAERCVGTLVELIQTKVTYVVQEAVIVIKVRGNTYIRIPVLDVK